MAFSKKPRSIGNTRLIAGTRNRDTITGIGGEAVFGGAGNDSLTGVRSTKNGYVLANFLVGGAGDDSYRISAGSFSVISDQGGGSDFVDLSSMSATSTFVVTLEKGRIGFSDGYTIVVADNPFSGSNSAIEKVRFGGRDWTPRQLFDYAKQRGAYLGNTTFAALERINYLNFSLQNLSSSPAGIDAIASAAAYNSSIVA